jgi:hypothetical protein
MFDVLCSTATVGRCERCGGNSSKPIVDAVMTVAATAAEPPIVASSMPPPTMKGPRTTRWAAQAASPRRSRGTSSNMQLPLTFCGGLAFHSTRRAL